MFFHLKRFRLWNITPLMSLAFTCYIFYYVHRNTSDLIRENVDFFSIKNYNCNSSLCLNSVPGRFNVHIISHSHLDISWLKTFDEYYNGSSSSIDNANVRLLLNSVIKALLANSNRTFVISEIAYFNRWWNEIDSDKKIDVRLLINKGQLQFVSGGFVINDEANTHYTSIIDQMTLGLNFIKDTFGLCIRPSVAWQMDTFGHSKEMAYLLKEMNFKVLFLNRVPEYLTQLTSINGFQFLWNFGKSNTSKNIVNNLYTIIFPDGYCTPQQFCVDARCSQNNRDIKAIAKQVIAYVREKMLYYKSGHMIIPLGCDFHFQDASRTFKIFDKILNIINNDQQEFHAFYSTPNCYVKSILSSVNNLKKFDSDLFPLHDTQAGYWIGFYSTRPIFKYIIRITNNIIRMSKKISSLSAFTLNNRWLKTKESLYQIMQTIARMQHHDTITGTSRKIIMNSNLVEILESQKLAENIFIKGLDIIMKQKHINGKTISLSDCPLLNVSYCEHTDNISPTSFIEILLYNALPYPTHIWISLPVSLLHRESYEVTNTWNILIKADLLPIDRAHLKNKERPSKSKSKYNLIFKVELPQLGFTTYIIRRKRHDFWDLAEKVSMKNCDIEPHLNISNKFINFNLNMNSDIITVNKSGEIFKFSIDIQCYCVNTELSNSMSGLYISVLRESPKQIRSKPFTYVLKGTVIKEIRRRYQKGITITIRLFDDEDSLEIEWCIGGIIQTNKNNKEFILVYKDESFNNSVFYTDSNGRLLMKRIINSQSPIESNYYPITSHVIIGKEDGLGMAIHTDRSHGVGGRNGGSVEIMLNRIIATSDGTGFTENLQDTGTDHKYLSVVGRNWIEFHNMYHLKINRRIKSNEIFTNPLLFIKKDGIPDVFLKYHIGILKQPKHLNILTLEPIIDSVLMPNRHILRLENLKDFSGNATLDYENRLVVNIKNLLLGCEVIEVMEMNLSSDKELFSEESKIRSFTVVLYPMDIITLIIKITQFEI